MPQELIDSMGMLNRRWGVCGFTSALYALHENSPGQEAGLAGSAEQCTRVAAEIKSFLRYLEAEGNALMLREIESFTSSFDGFSGFKIDDYIRRVDAVAANGQSKAIGNFSLALQPEAVAAYLDLIGFRNARVLPSGDLGQGKNELILGLKDPAGKLQKYGGLAHYVYKKAGRIYSWGLQFTDIAHPDFIKNMGGATAVCVAISPHG